MPNPIVTSLPTYVEQRRLPLIGKANLGAKTARLLTLQTGIKHAAALNLINTNVEFGDGRACGWNPAGTTELSQRILTVGNVSVNMPYCDRILLDKWAGYQVRVAAGEREMPFEEDFMESVASSIADGVEQMIWKGDTSSPDKRLNRFDGFLKILGAESDVVAVTIGASASPIEAVNTVLLAIPTEALHADTVIFASPEFVRAYGIAIVLANLYHHEGGRDMADIVIPGSNVRLIAAPGLAGTKKIVAGQLSNMFYGVDMMSDSEEFSFWYSKDNREFRLDVSFNAGVQVAWPDRIVVATLDGAATTDAGAATTDAGAASGEDQGD